MNGIAPSPSCPGVEDALFATAYEFSKGLMIWKPSIPKSPRNGTRQKMGKTHQICIRSVLDTKLTGFAPFVNRIGKPQLTTGLLLTAVVLIVRMNVLSKGRTTFKLYDRI